MSMIDPELSRLIHQFKKNMEAHSKLVDASATRPAPSRVHKTAGRTQAAWEMEAGRYLVPDEVTYLSHWEDMINGHCLLEAVLKKEQQKIPFAAVVFLSASTGYWRYGYAIPKSEPFDFCDYRSKYAGAAAAKMAFRSHVAEEGFEILTTDVLSIAARLESAKTDREIRTGRQFGRNEDLSE